MNMISTYEDYVKYYDSNRFWADFAGVNGFSSLARELRDNFGWRIGTTLLGWDSKSDFFKECRRSRENFEKAYRMGVDFWAKS
jgi:hypothetical protein